MRLIDADKYLKETCTYKDTGCGSCIFQGKCIADEPTVLELPDNPTNGDIIFALNETAQVYKIELDVMNKKIIKVCVDGVRVQFFDLNWWNAPYKKEVED